MQLLIHDLACTEGRLIMITGINKKCGPYLNSPFFLLLFRLLLKHQARKRRAQTKGQTGMRHPPRAREVGGNI